MSGEEGTQACCRPQALKVAAESYRPGSNCCCGCWCWLLLLQIVAVPGVDTDETSDTPRRCFLGGSPPADSGRDTQQTGTGVQTQATRRKRARIELASRLFLKSCGHPWMFGGSAGETGAHLRARCGQRQDGRETKRVAACIAPSRHDGGIPGII